MASTFPAAIANEPPPLDGSSEDEDSEEFRSHGLKLDVPSGEPTPVSTPFKRPITRSPEKTIIKPQGGFEGITDLEESDDAELEIVTSEAEDNSLDGESEGGVLPKENGTGSPDSLRVVSVNGIDNEYHIQTEFENCELIEKDFEQLTKKENTKADTENVEVPISAYDNCDNTSNTINDETEEESQSKKGRDSTTPAEEVEIVSNNSSLVTPHTSECDESVKGDSCETSAGPMIPETDKTEDNQTHTVEKSESLNPENDENEEFPEFQIVNTDRACNIDSTTTHTTESGSSEETESPLVDDDDFDDDFGAFQSIANEYEAEPQITNPVTDITPTPHHISSTEVDDDDDDDFGDFAQVPIQPTPTCTEPPPVVAQPFTKDSDDFADFQDCSFQSSDVSAFSTPPSSASDFSLVSTKIDSILKTLFATDSSLPQKEIDNLRSIDSEISISKDGLWAQVQDFEGSQGLMFKWLNSLTDKHLLTSLNIDTSTIMYHEKWGTIEVPKFAASLVQSPLQPQSCNFTDMHSRKDVHHTMVINNNNNISDGMSCQEHDKSSTMSAEAQEILRQLPDLSYMRANTLVFPETSPSGL